MIKFRSLPLLFLSGILGFTAVVEAAPEVLTYSGRITVSGQPFVGQGEFKFAFVDRSGRFSYWTNDGNFTLAQEPALAVAANVANGVYTVRLGDVAIANMQALPGQIFRDHNDAHLRIWFRAGASGAFDLLSPDQPVTSAPYALGGQGALAAASSSSGSVSNGAPAATPAAVQPQSSAAANVGAYARLVANGPNQPSATLVLLTGDSADIVTYYADLPGRLEYAFGEHTFAFPKVGELLADQKTLVGPSSIRLVAPTGIKNVAILEVKRANGRDPAKLEGAPAPPAEGEAPVATAPAIVSVPATRSVARGGTTTLFVSASGENLSYQWKKNGQAIPGATSPALPLENATGADAGSYVVEVGNADGNATSQAITVTVKMPVVPTGVYRINNSEGATGHEVALTSFSIDQHEVTKAFWDEVYTWAVANGYDFSNPGIAEGPEYPVHSINWYDAVKWANALSERDGHVPCYYTDDNCTVVYKAGQVDLTNYNVKWNADGYRLPTETEWEVASRGGLVGSKYAWGESPSTTRANFDQTLHGATVPVGSFPANGYGLYEVGGNLREWTWDWNDTEELNNTATYEYDFHEIFTHSTAGTLGLVNTTDTNATWTWRVADAQEVTHNTGSWVVKKTIDLLVPTFVTSASNIIKSNSSSYTSYCKMKFHYVNGTSAESAQQTHARTSYSTKSYDNPYPGLKVAKVEVILKANSWSYEKDTSIGKAFIANVNGSVEGVVFNLPPQYQENNGTHFKVMIETDRENGDDVWFELIDGNSTKTYAGTDFGKLLTLPAEVKRPKKLRVLLKAKSSGPTAGGTALREVYWRTSNPKSHWTGTQRVLRDNHYAEGLETLSKRRFSTPDKRFSTVGFRLVQRP